MSGESNQVGHAGHCGWVDAEDQIKSTPGVNTRCHRLFDENGDEVTGMLQDKPGLNHRSRPNIGGMVPDDKTRSEYLLPLVKH